MIDDLPIGHGVRLIVQQGNLDHWFSADLWGDIKPSPQAFDMALSRGMVEAHFMTGKYRLTDYGREVRRRFEKESQ